jgi:hypothetical protein
LTSTLDRLLRFRFRTSAQTKEDPAQVAQRGPIYNQEPPVAQDTDLSFAFELQVRSILMRPRRASWIRKRWRIAAVVLLAGVIAFLSGITSWPDQIRGMRPASKSEEFYRYVAQELAEPALCEKIPWSVMSPGGFFISLAYERSECYEFTAGRTKNPWLCRKVKRLGALSLFSEQTSMWTCLSHAIHGWNTGIGISQPDLVGFFNEMGYDPDTLHLEGITPEVVSVKDIYRQLPDQPDILTRIQRVSGAFDGTSNLTTSDVEDSAYLADLAALVSKDPRWCFRIPEDLALANQKATFHDWCLFTLATNTKDAKLCSRIPIRADGTDVRMSLQAQCGFQVNSPYPSNTRYAPEVPDDDDRTRILITRLNYEIPRAKDLPLERTYAAYHRFFDELKTGNGSPAHGRSATLHRPRPASP